MIAIAELAHLLHNGLTFVPQSKLTAHYAVRFSIALVVELILIVVPKLMQFVLLGIALLIEISNGPITHTAIHSVPAQVSHTSHIDEWFGLFAIVALSLASVESARYSFD